jgi:hypothetical protein
MLFPSADKTTSNNIDAPVLESLGTFKQNGAGMTSNETTLVLIFVLNCQLLSNCISGDSRDNMHKNIRLFFLFDGSPKMKTENK